jgi:hypothetical protein
MFAARLSAAASTGVIEEVPIVGGTAPFAQALGINPPPDPARFIPELSRLLYNIPEGKNPELDAKVQRLTHYLELVRTFQASLAAVQGKDGSINLSAARQKYDRDRLKDFFETIGLKLREKNRAFSVERTNNKEAAERVRLLKQLGVDLEQLQSRLNAGESVRIDVPTESIPIPLSTMTWSTVIFQRQVAPRDLAATILSDRNAALLSRGLAGLDDPTLEFLAQHPNMLARLYEHDAAVFGAFGDALRIRGGAVVPAGGPPAIALWEGLVDEKTAKPDRFVRELFSNAGGHVAYLYSTIEHLPPNQRAFALGLAIKDTGIRLERFKAVAAVAEGVAGEWQPRVRPFIRPAFDLAMLLAHVRVGEDGLLPALRPRRFWSRAFESSDLSDDAAKQLRNLGEDGDVDAAWIGEQVLSGDVRQRQVRFEQLTFGQRAFGQTETSELPDALIGIRGYAHFPMLMLELERIGARKPATFAAAAKHADRLSGLDPTHAFVALSQFQGSLALLARLVRVASLDRDHAELLVSALAATGVNDDGWYRGAVARWASGALAHELQLSGNYDIGFEQMLAGRRRAPGASTTVAWEGHQYGVDLSGPEQNRLQRIREKTHRASFDDIFELSSVADALAKSPSMADVQMAVGRLKSFPKIPVPQLLPEGVNAPKEAREGLAHAIEELSKITKQKDLKKTVSAAETLSRVVDWLMADALRSVVYSLNQGDSEAAIAGVDVSWRHDFGLLFAGDRDGRARMPWSVPSQVILAGSPWHLRGALFNLDLALAPLALKQVSKPHAGPAVLSENERGTFALTAVLLNPFELRDGDLDVIANGIRRGRERMQATTDATELSGLLRDELAMDGWRRRAIAWSREHQANPLAFVSLAELLQFGGVPAGEAPDRWGAASHPDDSCVCTRLGFWNQWFLMTGRPQLGLLGTQMFDLNLRVAVLLHDLHLPAALAKDVLLAATQDFIDEASPTDADDWLTLIRAAQNLARERVEDYVAALTANGPLVAVAAPSTKPAQ